MGSLYNFSVTIIFCLAGVVFLLLFFIPAPYGKFLRKGWGPSIRTQWAWMIMEAPSPLLMICFFFLSPDKSRLHIILICLWLAHYIHRTFIYPFSQSGSNKSYPVILAGMAFLFNCFNGFINGYGVFYLIKYDKDWLTSWQFITGLLLFISGFLINKIADEKLRKLRNGNREEYVLPRGWLFEYISCPHYFGEIIEWAGWAVMTWSLPGLAFFVFTFANLFPRAIASNKWYKVNFPDYPSRRKAVIPFII